MHWIMTWQYAFKMWNFARNSLSITLDKRTLNCCKLTIYIQGFVLHVLITIHTLSTIRAFTDSVLTVVNTHTKPKIHTFTGRQSFCHLFSPTAEQYRSIASRNSEIGFTFDTIVMNIWRRWTKVGRNSFVWTATIARSRCGTFQHVYW